MGFDLAFLAYQECLSLFLQMPQLFAVMPETRLWAHDDDDICILCILFVSHYGSPKSCTRLFLCVSAVSFSSSPRFAPCRNIIMTVHCCYQLWLQRGDEGKMLSANVIQSSKRSILILVRSEQTYSPDLRDWKNTVSVVTVIRITAFRYANGN